MYLFYNPKAKLIAKSIKENPKDWEGVYLGSKTMYTLKAKTGLQIWTANGWLFTAIREPHTEKLGLFGRTHVWWRVLMWELKNKPPPPTDLNKRYVDGLFESVK